VPFEVEVKVGERWGSLVELDEYIQAQEARPLVLDAY